MNVHLHIDRVVIDGPLDVDRDRLAAAISDAVSARLQHGAPTAADEPSRRGPDVLVGTGRAADAIAHVVAVAVVPGEDR